MNWWLQGHRVTQFWRVQRYKQKAKEDPNYVHSQEVKTDRILGGIVVSAIALVAAPAMLIPTIVGYLVWDHITHPAPKD